MNDSLKRSGPIQNFSTSGMPPQRRDDTPNSENGQDGQFQNRNNRQEGETSGRGMRQRGGGGTQ
jgi:hypothetical protein